jgi:peptidoglycan/LPS O-acetylase OafA/YrhL
MTATFFETSARSARPPLPALTGLRFVAALLVAFFHFQFLIPGLGASHSPAANIVHSGYIGVSLFFVLSGFILAYTYLDVVKGMKGTVNEFWQARFARVYPVYLTALIFSAPLFIDVAFFHQVGVTHLRDTIKAAVLTPLLLQGWTPKKAWMWDGPAWSLSAEAFFYLLFPLIGVAIARLSRAKVFTAGAIAFALALVGPVLYAFTSRGGIARVTPTTYGPWIAFLKFSPLVHLPEFIVGVATGVMFLQRRDSGAGGQREGWIAFLASAGIFALLAVSDRIPYLLLNGGLLAPLFALLIYSLASGQGIIAATLSTRAAQLLGGASYALYLIHLPLSNYLTRLWTTLTGAPPSGFIALAGYLVVAIALALIIFRFIEQPARRYLRARPPWRVTETVRAIALYQL